MFVRVRVPMGAFAFVCVCARMFVINCVLIGSLFVCLNGKGYQYLLNAPCGRVQLNVPFVLTLFGVWFVGFIGRAIFRSDVRFCAKGRSLFRSAVTSWLSRAVETGSD